MLVHGVPLFDVGVHICYVLSLQLEILYEFTIVCNTHSDITFLTHLQLLENTYLSLA
jgi:hypothetical protein